MELQPKYSPDGGSGGTGGEKPAWEMLKTHVELVHNGRQPIPGAQDFYTATRRGKYAGMSAQEATQALLFRTMTILEKTSKAGMISQELKNQFARDDKRTKPADEYLQDKTFTLSAFFDGLSQTPPNSEDTKLLNAADKITLSTVIDCLEKIILEDSQQTLSESMLRDRRFGPVFAGLEALDGKFFLAERIAEQIPEPIAQLLAHIHIADAMIVHKDARLAFEQARIKELFAHISPSQLEAGFFPLGEEKLRKDLDRIEKGEPRA